MDLQHIPGLGKKRIEVLAHAGITDVPALLRYIPRSWLDRTVSHTIQDLQPDSSGIVVGTISRCGPVYGKRARFQAILHDSTGDLTLIFFSKVPYWQKRVTPGSRWVAIGRVQEYRGMQMVHPELQPLDEEGFTASVVPVYSISEEMRVSRMEQAFFRKLFAQIFAAPWLRLHDACPVALLSVLGLVGELENLKRLHLPRNMVDVYQGRRQLKIMELLPLCLRMVQRRRRMQSQGVPRSIDRAAVEVMRGKLPFVLTQGQEQSLERILTGMEAPGQFHALLQGDVGSGKTVVAMLSMLAMAMAGHQCALLVPTDILARQHVQSLQPYFAEVGLRLGLLLGATKTAERRELLRDLANGSLHVVVGTHALFSSDVCYADLGLVVVDEQHRFGVRQREALLAKGMAPELLVMSATPIPRSLAMTLYGDLDSLIIRDKPPGRLPVKTRVVETGKRQDLMGYVLKECLGGNQAYWIVSLVEDSEESTLHSIESLYDELAAYSKEWRLGYVHGRQDAVERERILGAFAAGEIQVLVSTTVVEVGVNVPNANLMVIESPERFGLAQLHQLRGRVGRGSLQAWCFLIVDSGNSAKERLEQFSNTLDGFEISELDLSHRGAGNLEGTAQSGSWVLRWFDWVEDRKLIEEVLSIAENVVDNEYRFDVPTKLAIEEWYADRSRLMPEHQRDGVH